MAPSPTSGPQQSSDHDGGGGGGDGADADRSGDDGADSGGSASGEDPPGVEADVPNPDLPAEVDTNGPSGSTGHSAVDFDGVYAGGVPVGIAMATTRHLESRNDYTAQAAEASASGAYQIIDSTWNGYNGYERAVNAPPAVQDQFAYEAFVAILKRYGNDVSKIPVAWYYPRAIGNDELMDTVPMPEAGNTLTPREYQTLWMQKFYELLGAGGPPFVPEHDATQPYVRSIAFPLLGPTFFANDWGFPRGMHGERSHEGTDLMAERGQPLRAAVDATVTRIRYTNEGTAGVVVSITDEFGYRYNYFHINDDTPGTTDNDAPAGLRVHPALTVGSTVKAGQIIGFVGDSGNAVGVPHLHFEIRDPHGNPMNPYPSLLAAQQREQCSVAIGPWSTAFLEPGVEPSTDRVDLDQIIQPAGTERTHQFDGSDGASWEIGADGTVRASGMAAVVAPPSGVDCPEVPRGEYGTDALGIPLNLLPEHWWAVDALDQPVDELDQPADALDQLRVPFIDARGSASLAPMR